MEAVTMMASSISIYQTHSVSFMLMKWLEFVLFGLPSFNHEYLHCKCKSRGKHLPALLIKMINNGCLDDLRLVFVLIVAIKQT